MSSPGNERRLAPTSIPPSPGASGQETLVQEAVNVLRCELTWAECSRGHLRPNSEQSSTTLEKMNVLTYTVSRARHACDIATFPETHAFTPTRQIGIVGAPGAVSRISPSGKEPPHRADKVEDRMVSWLPGAQPGSATAFTLSRPRQVRVDGSHNTDIDRARRPAITDDCPTTSLQLSDGRVRL